MYAPTYHFTMKIYHLLYTNNKYPGATTSASFSQNLYVHSGSSSRHPAFYCYNVVIISPPLCPDASFLGGSSTARLELTRQCQRVFGGTAAIFQRDRLRGHGGQSRSQAATNG